MKNSLIIGLILFLTLAGGVWLKDFIKERERIVRESRERLTRVVVEDARVSSVTRQVEALGDINARESVTISSKMTETVKALYFESGQQVQQGELLVQLENGVQQARVREAKAKLTDHQREYERIEELVKVHTIARSQLDKLQTSIEVAQAEVARFEAEMRTREIRAPFDGLLGLREVSSGALVTSNTSITTLDDLEVVHLDFNVPERHMSVIRPGKPVVGQVSAYPEDRFFGTVVSIDSRIDPTTRSVMIRAELNNRELKLRPGMLMTLRLITDEREGIVVPEEAIMVQRQDQYLFVAGDDDVIERRRVRVGWRTRGKAEILSGLSEGERVVIRGIDRVRGGQTVEVTYAERFTHMGERG
ncbi:efflux RND transporter periplasmic adaptor subunit [Ferrimonas pelagia]|uniref:Efflux RND transporter periplasmic adaptor subunit n=1 Tax=Ferrimonas pelagia TaxID=1177826 RepID=A0ABP9ELI8_9GAMM